MATKPKKPWIKPELTSISVQGVGNYFCTTGLKRGIVCGKNNIPTGTVTCQQSTKNTVFS